MPRSGDGSPDTPTVLVVGGGISGCACAAALAARGIAVTVVSSALDTVGLPGYGPEVVAGPEGLPRVLRVVEALPAVLREVWVESAVVPEGRAEFVAVDRRMLSVETKRALEQMPGLRLRQALVVGLHWVGEESAGIDRSSGSCSVVLNTAFGEEIGGDAVVIAAGLALGGGLSSGDAVLAGGRYDETPGEGLMGALEELGAVFEEVTVEVGPWFPEGHLRVPPGDKEAWTEEGAKAVEALPLRAALGFGVGDGQGYETSGRREVRKWPQEAPPAPNWSEHLRPRGMVVRQAEGGRRGPLLSPDGRATGEVHLWQGMSQARMPLALGGGGDEDAGSVASRMGHRVEGVRVANAGPRGRVRGDAESAGRLWVAGRAGGACGYLESLLSGVEVAEDICCTFARGGAEDPGRLSGEADGCCG